MCGERGQILALTRRVEKYNRRAALRPGRPQAAVAGPAAQRDSRTKPWTVDCTYRTRQADDGSQHRAVRHGEG